MIRWKRGKIISQDPESKTSVKLPQEIKVVVSPSAKTIKVPSLLIKSTDRQKLNWTVGLKIGSGL